MSVDRKTYQEARQHFLSYLENKCLRKTPERFAILETIYALEGHFNIELLHESIKKKGHKVSRATVYNTLNILLACQMVIKHQFGDTEVQYEKSFQYRQHDHLVCIQCHKVTEFCDPRIQSIQNTIEKQFNVRTQYHSLTLYVDCEQKNCERRK